eukprot:TRINITY_DN4861_c0_g1_i1.p1 TRINITY_DN4861_c0_g1~~TRINITY_DN4861_c0_g1_i1.p1  ORF type:complete len:256 (+),score=69.95 TRINITY_DN4861_c0_g1_i1:96-863(+)
MPTGVSHGVGFPTIIQEKERIAGAREVAGVKEVARDDIIRLCRQKSGSQYLQTAIDRMGREFTEMVFSEVVGGDVQGVITDQFGNYVVQKLLKRGTDRQMRVLADEVIPHTAALATHMYGCRVLQTALQYFPPEVNTSVLHKLLPVLKDVVIDPYGNHVVQKCVEYIPSAVGAVLTGLKGSLVSISKHIYGCRIVEKILSSQIPDPQLSSLICELMSSLDELITDQFGNYVVQYVVSLPTAEGRCVEWGLRSLFC